MASETALPAMNGNYASQQAYDQQNQAQASTSMTGSVSSGAFSADPANTPSTEHAASTANGGNTSVPKDEVGWYFVEQYYTTLSKNPEKLHVSFLISLVG